MFVVVVQFSVLTEHSAAFRAAVLQQAKNSLRLESECHVFDVCSKADRPNLFYLYEKYTDSLAFEQHLKSEHFRTFDAKVTPWLEEKTVDTWVALEDER